MTETKKLYQYSTLAALMAGLYRGTLTVGELLAHGDTGLGTLDAIDGELIVLDGQAYQAQGDGTMTALSADVKLPYAAVVHHQADVTFRQARRATDKELAARMMSHFDGKNLFRSIKIQGRFERMHVRMIARAEPGTPFVEASRRQPEHTVEGSTGTIVGFWTPELFHGISVAGFHLHYLSDDQRFGGHIMDYVMREGTVEIGTVTALDQAFPAKDPAYLSAQLDLDQLKKDIDEAE